MTIKTFFQSDVLLKPAEVVCSIRSDLGGLGGPDGARCEVSLRLFAQRVRKGPDLVSLKRWRIVVSSAHYDHDARRRRSSLCCFYERALASELFSPSRYPMLNNVVESKVQMGLHRFVKRNQPFQFLNTVKSRP